MPDLGKKKNGFQAVAQALVRGWGFDVFWSASRWGHLIISTPNISLSGNLTKIFQKSQIPGGLPGGEGMGGFGIDCYKIYSQLQGVSLCKVSAIAMF